MEDHDDHIPDDFKYFMEEPENNTCNNANDDEEVFVSIFSNGSKMTTISYAWYII